MATGTKRLSKPERRAQLLEAARVIVGEAGTEALTLQVMADRAGVTKPVAYEHFGTREGALIALYRQLDAQQVEAAREALANAPATLEAAAEVIAAAYVDCCMKSGPAYLAISAALEGSQAMHAVKDELRETYLEQIHTALKPFMTLTKSKARPLFIGFLGAADAMGGEAAAGRMSRRAAIEALTQFCVGALGPYRAD